MNYEIVPICKLIPLEKVFPTHLKNLEEMINADGFVLKAIIADRKTGAILDGSHRYVYFLKNGYKEVPVYWADYDDENIRVGSRLGHRFLIDSDITITKKECRRRALAGELFPPRTTRHFFTFRKSDISLNLSSLEKGDSVDVSSLIADVSVADEIDHNKGYISEIDEEINTIVNYLSEVTQTKEYLERQISLMDQSRKVAFFPGKFHPPHLGHLCTILDLVPKFRKIIIGVSEDRPKDFECTTPDRVIEIMKLVFKNFDNIEVVLIDGVLTERTSMDGLPDFDILISGNKDVLDWANDVGILCECTPRSPGFLYSGTEIRQILGENSCQKK